MIDGLSVLAVVPARGGSKGLPLKNLRPIRGRPLVALAGDIAAAVPEVDRSVVSTDHPEIARVAQAAGLAAPFMRPQDLSGDRIADWDVLNHALLEMERIDGRRYDIVVMLQPTSPMRTPAHVSGTIRALVAGGWDAVWTVSETDSKGHPLKQFVVRDGALEYWDERGAAIIARQQLTPVYHRNGVAYAIRRECIIVKGSIKGDRTGAYVIEEDQISIDTEYDLQLVEFFLARQGR